MQTELKAASELCVEFLKMVKFFLKCDVYTIGKYLTDHAFLIPCLACQYLFYYLIVDKKKDSKLIQKVFFSWRQNLVLTLKTPCTMYLAHSSQVMRCLYGRLITVIAYMPGSLKLNYEAFV